MFENVHQIILKVTKDCNLRCTYCYLRNKDPYKNQTMSYDLFQKLIDRIVLEKSKNHRQNPNPKLQIVFHGGEPTLLGTETIEKFINYAKAKIPETDFSIQTNLTLLDENWLNLIIKHQLHPGISMDGIKSEQNSLRSRNFNFLGKVKLLQKYNITAGILMVVSSKNLKFFRQTLAHLCRFFKIKSLKANYVENVLDSKFGPPEISGKEYFDFVFKPALRELISKNKLIEHNLDHITKKFITNYLLEDLSDQSQAKAHCSTKFCGGGNHLVEVGPTGNVCSCGRWDEDEEINTFGNILTDLDLFGLSSFQKTLNIHLQKIKDIRVKKCDLCSANDICDFGCPAFAYLKFGKIKIREELSCTLFTLLKELLLKNIPQIILAYAKASHWPVHNLRHHYQIEIPGNNFQKKRTLTLANLSWDNRQKDKNVLCLNKAGLQKKLTSIIKTAHV